MTTEEESLAARDLIDRIQAGDASARRLLLEQAYERLSRIAAKMLSESFPALRNRHEVQSVVHEAWIRLLMALDKVSPPTAADFFRLAAFKIRQVLLDMADREKRLREREHAGLQGADSDAGFIDPANATYDPRRLAAWTDFHQRVEQLSADQRAVFEMHYYFDLPQAEVARVLGLHPRKVSYLWIAATESLADFMEGIQGPR